MSGATVVIQMARLGDFLQTTPLLRALKQRHADAPLVALVSPSQAPLASACPWVDQVWELEPGPLINCFQAGLKPLPSMRERWEKLTGHLRSLDVARVYNLNLGPMGASLAGAWPQAQVKGWRLSPRGDRLTGEDWTGFIMDLVADRRLTRIHLSDILSAYADPPGPISSSLEYQLSDSSAQAAAELLPQYGPKLVLQLGANSPLRRWPIEYHAALAEAVLAQGLAVILVGSPGERIMAERFLSELGPISKRVCNLTGKTDLPGLAGVLAQADLVISNDTGTLHLATAVGAKVLGLYMGPAVLHETGPYGPGHLVLQARDHCGPCQEQQPICGGAAQCRRLLSPGAVYKAALALLDGQDAKAAGSGLGLGRHAGALVGAHDGFGQVYYPLEPQESDWRLYLALALRESGRMLLRSAYEPDWHKIVSELQKGYTPCPEKDRPALNWLGRAALELAAAAKDSDREAALNLLAKAPKLRPLADLVGIYPPERLNAAVRAAARTMQLAMDPGS